MRQKLWTNLFFYRQRLASHKTLITSSLVGVLFILVSVILFVSFKEEASQPQVVGRDTGITAFEPVNCPEPKPHNPAYYSGKMIDSHFHLPTTENIPFDTAAGKFLTEEGERDDPTRPPVLGIDTAIPEIACLFAYEGTARAISFFRVATIREERMLGVERKKDHLSVMRKTLDMFPNRFISFINLPDEPGGFPTVDAAELEATLAMAPGLFAGYGEIGLYGSEGVPPLPPDSQRFTEIYPVVRKHNLVVYFHLGEGQKDSFRNALRDNPDINFIFHGTQLVDETDGRLDVSQLEEILENHKNAFYTVDNLYAGECILCADEGRTKEQLLAHLANYEPLLEEDLLRWQSTIEKYPDQLMWGTDRGGRGPWTLDREVGWTLADYGRAFIARLDSATQEKFAYKNAEFLLQNR